MEMTSEQLRAVNSDSKCIAILAGAGSGKTFTLTHRICHIIESGGAKPDEILALTFTSRAAQEMKRRIIKQLGDKATGIWVKTFHSYGLELLRLYPQCAGLDPKFEVADTSSRVGIIKQLLRKESQDLDPHYVLNEISKIKNGQIICRTEFFGLFSNYCKALRDNNKIDLDDMIWLATNLIRSNEDVRNFLHNKFKHILIDEYQDANEMQNIMVELSRSQTCSICVVGDDDQCIYEWRGSKPQYIREYSGRPDVETIFLSDNFRSQGHIVDLANSLICHNKNRVEKAMTPRLNATATPAYYKVGSSENEARLICSLISFLCQENIYKYKDIAILVRASGQSSVICDEMRNQNIPFTTKQQDVNAEFLQFIRVLFAILDCNGKNNLSRAINFPSPCLDSFTYMDLVEDNNWEAIPTDQVFLELRENDSIVWSGRDRFCMRYDMLTQMNARVSVDGSTTSAVEIINSLDKYYSGECLHEGQSPDERLRYVHQTMKIAQEWDVDNDDRTLKAFMDYLSCAMVNDDEILSFEDDDAVNILTCHRSKGLEYPVVIIPGLQVGTFPNDYYIQTEEDWEQERRLLYVAMTRAKEKLFITSAQNQMGSDQLSKAETGFVAEMPLLIQWRKERRQYKENLAKQAEYAPLTKEDVVPGSRVLHRIFGFGQIISVMEGTFSVVFYDDDPAAKSFSADLTKTFSTQNTEDKFCFVPPPSQAIKTGEEEDDASSFEDEQDSI